MVRAVISFKILSLWKRSFVILRKTRCSSSTATRIMGNDELAHNNEDDFPPTATADPGKVQFFQKSNPVTGKLEWNAENSDEHDYFTDIARSSYADMLHDKERNVLYYEAIRKAVAETHAQGKKAKVLDIGTGTGLLSMMAATAGAEHITAIEVFTPMAKIARRIVKANGFNNITIVNKHSTDVCLGVDLEERCNILITELFDTELIGEGALRAYQHAHEHLMEENCIAVPHRAITFAQVLESDLMTSWNELRPATASLPDGKRVTVASDPEMASANGGLTAVHDIQLSQVPADRFTILTRPLKVFEFEWASRALSTESRLSRVSAGVERHGTAEVVLSWWELEMYKDSDIVLSTAPKWCHPTPGRMQWRDHWIQSVYYLPRKLKVAEGDQLHLRAFHDDYSLWFDASSDERRDDADMSMPACTYPPRALVSRPRMGMLNDANRTDRYARGLFQAIGDRRQHETALCVGDFNTLAVLLAKIGFPGRVVAAERSAIARRGLVNLARCNQVQVDAIHTEDLSAFARDWKEDRVTLLVAEPFYSSSFLPWHDLHFWYARTALAPMMAPDAVVLPRGAALWMAGVELADLWKIRAPVGDVEGFDVSAMDAMIGRALDREERDRAEPHHLWEYPCALVTPPHPTLVFDFTQCVPAEEMAAEGHVAVDGGSASTCNAVAMWMEYDVADGVAISTGLATDERDPPRWSRHHKQAVFFLRRPVDITSGHLRLTYKLTFQPDCGEIRMDFGVA